MADKLKLLINRSMHMYWAIYQLCSRATKAGLQFFYPSHCRSCGCLVLPDAFLCTTCLSKGKPLVSLYIPLTKKYVMSVFAAGAYQDPLRSLVLGKLSSDLLASKQLGRFMIDMIPFQHIQCDLLIPIPLHWSRYAHRGYNQATEIARVIGKKIRTPVKPILARHKRTAYQSTLAKADRQKNVQAVFKINWLYSKKCGESIKGKHIVLIDDLYTTGATLKNAAHILLPYEPASITAVVACRAI